VTLTALPSTFVTSADSSGCPVGFAGKFSFLAALAPNPDSPELANLQVQVHTLSHGNLLQNADSGPAGVASMLTVPRAGSYGDGILSPGEVIDIPFAVCLKDHNPFRLLVDVLSDARGQ
jgi:hypothetical protein